MVNLNINNNEGQPYHIISPRNLENELTNPMTATIETVSLNATERTSDVKAEKKQK